jgi:hypothetical protein
MYLCTIVLHWLYCCLVLWCFTPLSTIFQLYRGGHWLYENKDLNIYIYIFAIHVIFIVDIKEKRSYLGMLAVKVGVKH